MDRPADMERRESERIPTALDMQVYAYGSLVANGVTVDMSAHGLLLRIQQDYSDHELDPGKHLDVMLRYAGPVPTEQWLPVRVVRTWEDGIAARFVGEQAHAGWTWLQARRG